MAILQKRDPLVIDAGLLRHAIVIQAQSTTPDADTGEPATTWQQVLSTRAAISTASSREVYQAQQYASQVTHVVTMRWPGAGVAIGAGMQVLFGARTFTIQATENVLERNRVLKLMCVEVDGVSS